MDIAQGLEEMRKEHERVLPEELKKNLTNIIMFGQVEEYKKILSK